MAYATKAAAEGGGGFCHQFRAQIRHFAALNIVPDAFGGIEVRRIAGEPLDLQPVTLTPEELRHVATPVSGQVIPDEDHALAANKAFELLEKIDQAGRVEAVFLGAGKQAGFLPIPAEAQRRCYRSLIPMIATRL
jgi:hypothetical protein